MSNSIIITASAIYQRMKAEPAMVLLDDLAGAARYAFELAHDDGCAWCIVNDDERFQSALGALFLLYGGNDPVTARLKREMTLIRALSVAAQGVPLDMSQLMDDKAPEPIGLLGIFAEVKEANKTAALKRRNRIV